MQRYVGNYEVEPGFSLVFTFENNQLWVQPPGEEKLPVFAAGNHKFFLKAVDAKMVFIEEANKIIEVRVNLGGEKIVGKKQV